MQSYLYDKIKTAVEYAFESDLPEEKAKKQLYFDLAKIIAELCNNTPSVENYPIPTDGWEITLRRREGDELLNIRRYVSFETESMIQNEFAQMLLSIDEKLDE